MNFSDLIGDLRIQNGIQSMKAVKLHFKHNQCQNIDIVIPTGYKRQ